MKIYRCISNEKAFTMIEVIVSLVLIGIMVAIAGFGLVNITRGYVFTKQSTDTLLKAQVAMTRIIKELSSIRDTDTISAAANTSVAYTNVSGSHTIDISGSLIRIDGVTLVDNVTVFNFNYFDAAGATTAVLAAIRRVDISFSLQGAQNVVSPFTNSAKIKESYY